MACFKVLSAYSFHVYFCNTVQNWDQESAESELDALEGADMMSDDEGSD